MNLRSSLNHLKQIGFWLWSGKYHILTFTAVILTIFYLVSHLGWGVNYYQNIVSAFFSITGILIILVQQILDARQFADHRPNTIGSWIMSYPTGKPITMSGETSLLMKTYGKFDVTELISENATIENKVDFLLRHVNNIQTAIGKVDDRINDVATSL